MPDADAIPVIDLGPYLADQPGALDHAAAELRHALTEIGFYSIVNHGVPSALIHEVYRQVARFHARPLDEKLKIKLDKAQCRLSADDGRYSAHLGRGAGHQAQYERGVLYGTRPRHRPSRRRLRPAFPGRQSVARGLARLPRTARRILRYAGAAGAKSGARLCPGARPARHILRWAVHRLPIQAARDPLPVAAEGGRRRIRHRAAHRYEFPDPARAQ